MTRTPHALNRAAAALLLAGFMLTVVLGLLSDGAHHDDDLTHYLMARWCAVFPEYAVNLWGRPGYTIPAAGLAWVGDPAVGWHALRILSAVVTALSAVLACRIAGALTATPRGMDHGDPGVAEPANPSVAAGVAPAWLVVAMCYVQPFNTLLAATTLTETFAAFYLVAAVYLLLVGRAATASAVFSLVLVTRHETVALLPVWWLAVWRNPLATHAWRSAAQVASRGASPTASPGARNHSHRGLAAVLSVAAPVLHNVAFYIIYGAWPVRLFLEPSGSTQYLPAGPLAYVPALLLAVPPVIAALAMLGAMRVARATTPLAGRRGALGPGWIVPALSATFVATHLVITAAGVFASGGYPRFMVTIAPLVAVLAAAGFTRWAGAWSAARIENQGTAVSAAARAEARGSLRASNTPAARWMVIAAVCAIGLAAVEWENRCGRLHVGTADKLWALRAAIGVSIIGCVAAAILRCSVVGGLASRVAARVAAAILAIGLAVQLGLIVRPLHRSGHAVAVREVVQWLRDSDLADRPIFTTHAWFAYDFDWAENPRAHKGRRLLASMPAGTIFVWDSIYSPSDFHRLDAATIAADAAYHRLKSFPAAGGRSIEFIVFEKTAPTPVPPGPDISYPPNLTTRHREVLGGYYIRR